MLTPPSPRVLALPTQNVSYRVLTLNPARRRRLVVLHGSGMDGLTCWGYILERLTEWGQVLVPDLRGVGATLPPSGEDEPFELDDVVADLQALLSHLGWTEFDLAGYSYGAGVALRLAQQWPDRVQHRFLLEPALFNGLSHEVILEKRRSLDAAIDQLLEAEGDAAAAITAFMDVVLPNRTRTPASERWVRERLLKRPRGLAYCLRATNRALQTLDPDALVAAQDRVLLLTGGKSHQDVTARAEAVAARYPGWRHVVIEGADHGLPVQKPQRIAALMNTAVSGPITKD